VIEPDIRCPDIGPKMNWSTGRCRQRTQLIGFDPDKDNPCANYGREPGVCTEYLKTYAARKGF
jgi:hypothetical protein